MKYDVEFRVNSGDLQGQKYRYVLASKNGAKMWSVTPLFSPAPSMYRDRIEMSITAGEHNVDTSGAVELRKVKELLDELRDIAEESSEEPVTMTGLDREKRLVRIDQSGFSVTSTIKEQGKPAEYIINFPCWGMYLFGEYDKE